MAHETPLQRICSSCGLTKPLSAFLYISSDRGPVYGSLCAACRSTGADRKKITPGEEDTDTRSRLRIGIKEKIYQEVIWERRLQEKKQQSLEEKKKNEALKTHKVDQVEAIHEEKKHRQADNPPESVETPLNTPSQDITTEPAPQETPAEAKPLLPEKTREELIQRKQEDEQKAHKLTAATSVNIDPITATRDNSEVYKRFQDFLGNSSPNDVRRGFLEYLGKRKPGQPSAKKEPKAPQKPNTPEQTPPDSPDNSSRFKRRK